MSLMQRWMESVEFRITEGSEFLWDCYPDAYNLDSWNGDQDGYSFSIVFSRQDQTVYEMSAYDYEHNRAYRWINPDFKDAQVKSAKKVNARPSVAWDDVDYIDLELEEDFFEKVEGIKLGEDYDTRVKVPLELPDHELFELMKLAHESDLTLNQLVEKILWEKVNEYNDRQAK